MDESSRPTRERQALLEAGQTEVRRSTAAALAFALLALLAAVPVLQVVIGPPPSGALAELGRSALAAVDAASTAGPLAGNRALLAGMDAFETRLEDESVLRAELLGPAQLALSGWLGAGNEQAYLGRGPWLFYRPDVDHVIGPGFLEPDLLERRRRGGNAWEAPPSPDPVPAIAALAEDLGAREIELLLLPTPVKPMILPGGLVWRRTEPPLHNPSWAELRRRVEALGVTVLDAGAWLTAMSGEGESVFLTSDTHWTPRAMEEVARRLAEEIVATGVLPEAPGLDLSREPRTVEGRGDIAAMLLLPEGQRLVTPQTVTTSRVVGPGGAPWRSDPGAAVLLLGDSFTNIFSEAGLGWGGGAGLAEQLSYFLERPVDRIALNAGGSNASRRALVDAVTADPDRLAAKRVVVYQFAARELSQGDWPVLRLPQR